MRMESEFQKSVLVSLGGYILRNWISTEYGRTEGCGYIALVESECEFHTGYPRDYILPGRVQDGYA